MNYFLVAGGENDIDEPVPRWYKLFMKLQAYLAEMGLTQVEFAKELGLAENAVSRYISGKRMPRRDTLKKIKRITKGRVTAGDFID